MREMVSPVPDVSAPIEERPLRHKDAKCQQHDRGGIFQRLHFRLFLNSAEIMRPALDSDMKKPEDGSKVTNEATKSSGIPWNIRFCFSLS